MDKDYFCVSAEDLEQVKELGIPYRWRDSCLDPLKVLRKCKVNNVWSGFLRCRELEKNWLQCQIDRERDILKVVELKPVDIEVRKAELV